MVGFMSQALSTHGLVKLDSATMNKIGIPMDGLVLDRDGDSFWRSSNHLYRQSGAPDR